MNATWVFFDLGDTLINEDPLRFELFRLLLGALKKEGIEGVDFAGLMDLRERAIEGGAPAAHYAIAQRMLAESAYERWRAAARDFAHHDGLERLILIPGLREALDRLASDYRLGLLADQPVEIVRKLRAWGIAHHFDILALNSVVGFQKPDARLYEWAIDQAGCRPHDAIMVGNRLDMDIVPAENLGMRTILLQWPAEAKGWEPADEEARLYVQSLCRTPNWPSVGRAGGADRAVHDAVGLMTAIRELTFA